jgi:putative ABC transport system permease protein
MLKYLPLLWASLARRKLRSILTLLSVTAGFTLFGVMMGTDAAFQQMVEVINRSVVVIGARFANELTDGMGQKIAAMPNVDAVSAGGGICGYYRNPKVRSCVMAGERPSSWPNLPLSPAAWNELRIKPDGVFISRMRAGQLGLKKGDHFTIISAAIPRADGGQTWRFQVLDVLEDTPYWSDGFVFGSYQYYKLSRPAADQSKAGWFQAVVNDPVRADETAMAIDARFANSAIPTDSISERAMRSNDATAAVNVAAVTRRVALLACS